MRIVDLTIELYDGFRSFPTHPKMTMMDAVTHSFSAPRYIPPCTGYASMLILTSDHMGTHVDAPFHFDPEGKTVEAVPLDKVMGDGILIDVSDKDLDQPIDAEMIRAYLDRRGLALKAGDIAIVRCWKGEWGEGDYHHARGLSLSGAKFLIENGVKAIGTDMGILETGADDMARPVHMFLLVENEIPIIENLAHLGDLKESRFQFIGLPLKIKGASGSPIRAIAIEA